MDTYIDKMAHAFYTILGLMAENLPDCGDEEYVRECSKTWFNALTEFKEAEQAARNLNEDTSEMMGPTKREFYVDTPIGKLHVWARHPEKDDADDYPGVLICFVPPDGDENLVACVEYESVDKLIQTCVYDLHDEIPHIVFQNGTSKDCNE